MIQTVKLVLVSMFCLSICLSCAGENNTPEIPGNSKRNTEMEEETKGPKIPVSPPNRMLDFAATSASKSAQGFGDDRLFDNDLSTSWITRVDAKTKAEIALILPGEGKGFCIEKLGMIGGVFGNDTLAKQVAFPQKVTVRYVKRGSENNSPQKEFRPTLSTEEALPEIEWLRVEKTCDVVRIVLVIESVSPSTISNLGIAELYVIAK